MIEAAEQDGLLKPGGTIVEPTSGNTGVGLAMAAAVMGYKCVFVMPDKVAREKVALLRAYGAEVVTTPTAVGAGEPESYYCVADRLTREIPDAFQPNQYFNPANPQAHYETTGPEIWRQTDGKIDPLVGGVGTGGTISGIGKLPQGAEPRRVGRRRRPRGLHLHPGRGRPYKVEGIGEDFFPGTFDPAVVDEWVQCQRPRLVRHGPRASPARRASSSAARPGRPCGPRLRVAERPADDLVVVLLPDTGRGYLSKLYNDDWMRENGFLTASGGRSGWAA